ncbi:MAG TPA: PVC-type heme-binding CxxCH protein, partial [Verrucomicrobiae bacterium]|nr:PVC-type heme-binding CxxCH protein [Verrucomicrobiae bacterium]
EDKDGDGHFDSRKVFTDEVQMLTSVEVGYGGVWLMCPPRLIFIPDRNGDDVPDAAPEVALDGFTVPSENYHNFANGLHFGPDGWLYGRCGASCPGEIGAPGTPPEKRVSMRGTIWRYHPVRKTFEALTYGCTNPWGHDWDEYGELFFINTVNGQLWHDFAGAHFVRPHTIDPNPRVYDLIDQHADHWHFDTAQGWAKGRDGKANTYGGGHAHIGMMIYQGDNWPGEYRGGLFTLNLHGRRANEEILERQGSGYVGHHGKDFFIAGDLWFRGMEISSGPDGGVFVLDWSDTGECHESTGVHRTSGRIYKITYGEPKQPHIGDLAKLSSEELVKLQLHPNEWFARHARLELATRAATLNRNLTPTLSLAPAVHQLRQLFDTDPDPIHRLRALWSLYVIGAADQDFLDAQLTNANEHIRAWVIRLLTDSWPLDTVMSQRPGGREEAAEAHTSSALYGRLVQLATRDPSGLVRLVLASTLQRLPVSERRFLASGLVSHPEDAHDHNLPLLIWYGLIPVAESDPASLAFLSAHCELPATRRFIARRLAEDIDKSPKPLDTLLGLSAAKSDAFRRDILDGMTDALTGWRKAKKLEAWDSFAEKLALNNDPALRERVRNLSVLFGDGRALDDVMKIALDQNANLAVRKSALQTLIDNRPDDLRDICERLLGTQFLNSVAARGLAGFDDPAVGQKLVRAYRSFHLSERPQLLAVLVSRATFANALLDAVAEGRIPRADLSPFHVRQIRSLANLGLNQRVGEVWGELHESSGQNQELIAKWKKQFTPATLEKADLSQGRFIFNLACSACHTLYGEGGKVGPDLSGAGRNNIDYLLENILDPSAVVSADFRMSVLKLKDGRVLNGIIAAKTERTVTLKTMTEVLTIERAEVESAQASTLSLMPEGLLQALTLEQARDLIGYLMHQTQVPLPTATKTALK